MPIRMPEGGHRKDGIAMPPEDLIIVGLDVPAGPDHELYDEKVHQPLDPAMVENVKKYGVIEPVLVRRDGDKKFQVTKGRHRVRWAREANKQIRAEGGKPWLVVVMFDQTPASKLLGSQLAENTVRVERTPLERARFIQRMMQRGSTVKDCADACGRSPATVKEWLKLLDLDQTIQDKVDRDEVKSTTVVSLAKLPREKQKARLAELETEAKKNPSGRPTVRQARQPTPHPTPPRREIRAALDYAPPDAVLAIKWMLGDIEAPWKGPES